MNKPFTLSKLNKMYDDAKRVDSALFAEQRTNILLKAGQHYTNRRNKAFDNLRSQGLISKDQKIRLTKNHIHKITNRYENGIIAGNPSVQATAYNEDELHDVKQAQMSQSVIDWVKQTNGWRKRQKKNTHDFVVLGELFGIVRFDYDRGEIMGKNEEGKNIRLGEVVIDRVFAFDMKRDPDARDEESTKWWIKESMVGVDELKKLAKASKLDIKPESITGSIKSVTKVFDGTSGDYRDVKNQALVKELFIKPTTDRPNGLYVMYTDSTILFEEELPFGIYPIVREGFDDLTTSPRSSSIIRVCRPFQIEINRAASKEAEHQITLGDDKIYIQKGSKISPGGTVHGVRAVQVSGKEPIISPGRNGSQYSDYGIRSINEMYLAVDLEYNEAENNKQGDPYQLLFQAMSDKKKYQKYAEKYEDFEIGIFEKVLDISKFYLNEQHIIKVAGQTEALNIPEFKRMDTKGFEVKVVAQSGDIEEKFGKILSITQTLQYAGGQLNPDQIGNLIQQLPLGNSKQVFSRLTIDSDNAINDILALDRGQEVPVNLHDKHDFLIEALIHRMKKSDFRFLDENVRNNYMIKLAQHEQIFAEQKRAVEQAQMGMVPTGGFLTTVNASWFNPATNRVERIKIPSESIQWMVQKLQTQGTFAAEVGKLPEQAQADIAGSRQITAPEIPGLSQPADTVNVS